MEKEDQRNFIVAMLLMLGLVFAWQTFFVDPSVREREQAEGGQTVETEVAEEAAPVAVVELLESVDEALETTDRITFDGEAVDGSIRVKGSWLDDLNLKRHFATTARENELRLLRPQEVAATYQATWQWNGGADGEPIRKIAGRNTEWRLLTTNDLTTDTPVRMVTEAGGLRIERTIRLDANYMFSFEDTVTNISNDPQLVVPIGKIQKYGDYRTFADVAEPGGGRNTPLAHTGLLGVIGGKYTQRGYKPLSEGKRAIRINDTSDGEGWLGFTDKYWMTVLVPDQNAGFRADFKYDSDSIRDRFEAGVIGTAQALQPGESITQTNRIFSGAKELSVLRSYKDELGVPRLDDAVDWGWLWFLTKPFFAILSWLEAMTGSFGLAIIAFVIGLKILLFPLYNKSYTSMAKMKKLAEPMKEIQERFAADPQRKQQEIMKLYRDEKANPLAGCLPILATIPIFFALYQTLIVTLEMRHENFLFLDDLSQPDPTAIGNLFGLIPFWSAEAVKSIPLLGFIIGIGILPVLYGVTTFLTQSLSPPPPDPTQRNIMMALPIVFMFVFAGFASGLVLYWVWNNILSLIQQYFIMRRNGVETEIGKYVKKLLGKAEEAT